MPTPPKTTTNIRKHLTNAERQARQAAESQLTRAKRVYVKAPEWLSDDGKRIFNRTKGKLRGLGILDDVDADTLAMYSDAVAKYQTQTQAMAKDSEKIDLKLMAMAQSWSRTALTFAEKLGITPNSRARLAKKRAEDTPPDDLEQLLSEVQEYMNGNEV